MPRYSKYSGKYRTYIRKIVQAIQHLLSTLEKSDTWERRAGQWVGLSLPQLDFQDV